MVHNSNFLDENVVGRVHSFQSLGAVDGPGLRFVVFMQGCPLRCAYCHNPDTWAFDAGEPYTAQQVAEKALRYRPYFKNGGGVTVSGGEPLRQARFVEELFDLLHREGIHTALDTSGVGASPEEAQAVLRKTDLVLCDLKFAGETAYAEHCGARMSDVLSFLKLTEEMQVPLWIRHVVVPGLSDSDGDLMRISALAHGHANLEKLELLPFRKLCLAKYEALGIPFPLANTPEMDADTLRRKAEKIGAI